MTLTEVSTQLNSINNNKLPPIFFLTDMNKFKNGLLDNGVMIAPAGNTVRMVTHREVSSNDVSLVIKAVSKSIQEL